MSYDKMTVVLVEAMKEMKKESDEKIEALVRENRVLKKRLEKIENKV